MNEDDILNFWFQDIEQSQWWVKDLTFDTLIIEKFSAIHQSANCCELFSWLDITIIIIACSFSGGKPND